jgi:hypothetical protein
VAGVGAATGASPTAGGFFWASASMPSPSKKLSSSLKISSSLRFDAGGAASERSRVTLHKH